jgi:predicted small metal-binding protein
MKEQFMKIIRCRDLGFECDQKILAESQEEVVRQATEHAHTVHGVQITPELIAQVQPHIQDLTDDELEQATGAINTNLQALTCLGLSTSEQE